MPSLIRRLYRGAKRRIKHGLREHRTFLLYEAARRLLARHDHEQVSVARLAREAGISVGAFYQRFPDKDAFLDMVVAQRLRRATEQAKEQLDPKRWQRSSASAVTRAIVEEMMRTFHGPSAGVVRTALKRGHLDREKLEPLLEYRAALGDSAVALLAPRARDIYNPARAVRAALQMAGATALDALLHERETLRPGSRGMAATLSAMVLAMTGAAGRHGAEGQTEEEQRPALDDDGESQDELIEMPVEEVVSVPSSHERPEPPSRKPARRPEERTGPKPPAVAPQAMVAAESAPEEQRHPEEQRQRKRRLRVL